MISKIPPHSTEYYIDPRRPDLFSDEDRDVWRKFHTILKDSPIVITVNDAFNFIESLLDENKGYAGGGFHYMFWFNSLEDQNAFIDECNTLYPKFIQPWMLADYVWPIFNR